MTIKVLNRIFYKKYFNVFCPLRICVNFLSNTQKLYVKKRFSIKNKFTFENEFHDKLTDTVHSESRTFSPHVLHEEKYSQLYSDKSDPDYRFISADLLSEESLHRQRNTKKLSQAKQSRKPSLTYQGEILFGVHPVYLALLQKRRIFHHLYTRKEIEFSDEENFSLKAEIVRMVKSMGIPVSYVDSRGLKILAPGGVHQGICLDAGFLPLPTWNEDQSEKVVTENNILWLVLDEILDPMNVGAIIRSSYYFGVNKIFTVKGNSCKLSPTVSKASSGSLEVINVYQIDSLEDFIKKRKGNGWSIVSTLAYSENKSEYNKSPISATEFNTAKPTILILGNEGKGISQTVLNLCDSLISIPPGQNLCEGIDSLNVSVATGVILYVLNSQTKNIKR